MVKVTFGVLAQVIKNGVFHLLVDGLALVVILLPEVSENVPHHLDVHRLLLLGVPRRAAGLGEGGVTRERRPPGPMLLDVCFIKRRAELGVWIPFWFGRRNFLGIFITVGSWFGRH